MRYFAKRACLLLGRFFEFAPIGGREFYVGKYDNTLFIVCILWERENYG